MRNRIWTRPELIKVLALYHQLPFGKMDRRNPVIKELAKQLERTPSAIALKLVNFASLDPQLRKRGVTGMSNTSLNDRAIWSEFAGKWRELADAHTIMKEIKTENKANKTESLRNIKTRIGQQFFRNAVLAAYEWRCCITNISDPKLLRASHIFPWAKSVENRLNPANGLCLNALHDAAFDQGFITLDDEYKIIVSAQLMKCMPQTVYDQMFGNYAGRSILLPERFRPEILFLKIHRESIFVGNPI